MGKVLSLHTSPVRGTVKNDVPEAEVEILHVGKDEWKENGRPYIVSREGRFGRVVKGGKVRIGDAVEILR